MNRSVADLVHAVVSSPVGNVFVVGRGRTVTACFFGDQRNRLPESQIGPRDDDAMEPARAQLVEYLAGERRTFDLRVAPNGDGFAVRVWHLLGDIPYGHTTTYGEIAEQMGNPNLAQAVGSANARNPIALIIPCHRVVGADGALVGYAGGLERKRFLLELEAKVLGTWDRLF